MVNIPVDELRGRLDELPRDREILVTCRLGQRAYYATQILVQNGFTVRTVAGGMLAHEIFATLQTTDDDGCARWLRRRRRRPPQLAFRCVTRANRDMASYHPATLRKHAQAR